MLRSQCVIGLLAALLVSFTPIFNSANAKSIVLNKTRITDFFKGVSIELNRPIVVSNKAGLYEISGEIDLTQPYKAISNIANKTNLIWYDDASAIYIYASTELRSEFISVNTKEEYNEIIKFLKLSKLYSAAYPPRYTKGAAFVSGPPKYVNVIKEAVAAYYNGLASDEVPEEPEPIEVIKMFPLRNRFVTDMRYFIRGTEKVVDGALTILKRLIQERNDDVKYLSIVADTLNNALYVKGKAPEVNKLKKLIDEIDIIREQIQLSLWIIDVDSSELKEVGTSFEATIYNDIFKIGLNGGSVILDQDETLSFVGAVNSLETEKKAKVLSRPVLITQNNTPAVIDTNETIYVKLIGNEEVSLKEITYGTILSVTPRVVKSPKGNDIEMMVEIEDGNQTADLIDGLPNIRRSVISTVGRITDSQSLLLGGFVRKQVSNQKKGIPILKDIPILSFLFSMDVENTSSIMRLFMIEPKIIDDPVAEFNRAKIMGLQSESFISSEDKVKANEQKDSRSKTQRPTIIDPMTGKGVVDSGVKKKVIERRVESQETDNEVASDDNTPAPSSEAQSPSAPQQSVRPNQRRIKADPRSKLKPYTDKRLNLRRQPQGNLNNQPQKSNTSGGDIIDRSKLNLMQPNIKVSEKARRMQALEAKRKRQKKVRNVPYVMVNPEDIVQSQEED